MSQGLEIFLICTIPRPGLKDNLNVEVRRVVRGFPGISRERFPASAMFPMHLWMISSQTPKQHRDLAILGLSENVDQRKPYSTVIPKRTKFHKWQKDGNYRGYHFMGFRWRSLLQDSDFLGKRSDNLSPNVPRTHQVWFSRLGVEAPVPPSQTLDLQMQEVFDRIPKEVNFLIGQEFEITYDEVAHIWGVQLLRKHGLQGHSVKLATTPGSKQLISSDPYLEVYRGMSLWIGGSSELTSEPNGELEFLEPMSFMIETIWNCIHSDGSGWVPDARTNSTLAPFTPIVKLKEWADAVYQIFYLPIVQTLCPELLADATIKVEADLSAQPKVKFMPILYAGLKFFELLNSIYADLKQNKQLSFQSIKDSWATLGNLFLEGFDFKMCDLSDRPVRVPLKKQIQKALATVESERSLQSYKYPKNAHAIITEYHWLRNLTKQFELPQSRNKLFSDIPDCIFAKTLNQNNLFGNHTMLDISTNISPDILRSITFAGSYKDVLVFMTEAKPSNHLQLQLCVIQANGTIRQFQKSGNDWMNGVRLVTYWEAGKIYILIRVGLDLILVYSDFSRCAGMSINQPICHTRKLCHFHSKVDLDTRDLLAHKLSSFISDTVYCIKNSSFELPSIWGISTTQDGIQDPVEFHWRTCFKSTELSKFKKFDIRGEFKPFITIIGTQSSQRLFLCIVYPPQVILGEPTSQLELMLSYFKSYRTNKNRSLRLIDKNYFKVEPGLITSSYPRLKYDFSVRVSELHKRDFLFLSSAGGLTFVFGRHDRCLRWFKINGKRGSPLPKLPGTELIERGVGSQHLTRYSYTWCSFLAAEKSSLDVYYLRFSY